jgi:transposase
VFLTSANQEVMDVSDVSTGPERRRRWSVEEKVTMVRESFEAGKTVSIVARGHGVNPNQLFHWCKLYQDGSRRHQYPIWI